MRVKDVQAKSGDIRNSQMQGGSVMRIRQISLIVAALAVALLALVTALTVLAGSTDSSAAPDSTSSHTLEHIYDRLDTGAATAAIIFTEPSVVPGTGTMHTLDEIYDLIGERAQVPKTGQTTLYATGDDGDLEKGVAWPSTRFITSTTGVVTDTLTGLIWLEDANCANATRNWSTALSDVTQLNTDGTMNSNNCGDTSNGGSHQTDWRLPNVRELYSLIHHSLSNSATWLNTQGFTDVQSQHHWSSTTYANDTSDAWYVSLGDGRVRNDAKTTIYKYVWPVRGGQ